MHAQVCESLHPIDKHIKTVSLYVCLHTGLEVEGGDYSFLYLQHIPTVCVSICVRVLQKWDYTKYTALAYFYFPLNNIS